MIDTLKARVLAAGLSNVSCEKADLYALPFEPESFDALVAANVLHLVPDFAAAIASFRRALRPGAPLVVPTFCHDETWRSALVSRALAVTGFPSSRRLTSRSLVGLLRDHGVQITRTEVVPGLIPICFVEGTFEAR